MNLLEAPWIPVERRSGDHQLISPHQLTADLNDDPIVAIASPRPDFTGALAQFLIGLLQTAFSPGTEDEWRRWFRQAPSPKVLEEAFAMHTAAFELDGGGPRFFQDLEIDEGNLREIGALLIDAPGGQTLKLNTDHFVKRARVKGMCHACTASALLTLQLNSPSGGRGHRTSLRGGGPLTTLAAPDPNQEPDAATLWHLCWLNVLTQSEMEKTTGNPKRNQPSDVFPWLIGTRTSENSPAGDTTPEDASPLQVFWGLPRRVRVAFERTTSEPCDLCGRKGPVVTHFETRPFGVNYVGPWRHPLSPYRYQEDGTPMPVHPRRGGLGYRDWSALAAGSRKMGVASARSIDRARTRLRSRGLIWAFGYDMDNMKARCWYERRFPVYALDEAELDLFRGDLFNLVLAAELVARNTGSCLEEAWFRKRQGEKRARRDLSFVAQTFWSDTEDDFFSLVDTVVAAIRKNQDYDKLVRGWHRTLDTASLRLFDLWAASDIARSDPKRVATARIKLVRFNRQKKIRDALLLGAAVNGSAT